MFLGDLPILRLNDHPPRSENPIIIIIIITNDVAQSRELKNVTIWYTGLR